MLPLLITLIGLNVHAQTPILTFDGVDDYVNLGNATGTGIRTIEMWFRPTVNINSSLANFATLAAREISTTNNTNEFSLAFMPNFVSNPGTLRFDIDGSNPQKSVFSDANSWNAGEWYHVAAVIDPINGLMLFINGIKQVSTHPNTSTTTNSTKITTLGCWGDLFSRYFAGSIEDVRFSSTALYTANFQTACPNQVPGVSAIGMWNFNENAGTIATDSSINGFNGTIVGATWDTSLICMNVGINQLEQSLQLIIHPNPTTGKLSISLEEASTGVLSIRNYLGQLVMKQEFNNTKELNISLDEPAGVYFLQIESDEQIITKQVVKN